MPPIDRSGAERRAGEERRLDERVARLEQRSDDQGRALESIAPVSVHFAEINLMYRETKEGVDRIETGLERMQERVDRRFDHLHTRLRRTEYAVVALSVTGIGALGGRVIPQITAAVATGPIGELLRLLS